MSLSVHESTVGVFVQRLTALSKFLAKAESHAVERKIDPAVLLGWRLAPDMFALARQVQLSSDFAKGYVARLAGREIPKYEDTEASFAQLQERIAKTIAFVQSVPASELEGAEARMLDLTIARQATRLGRDYLLHQALPNFHFHVTTAYTILRQCGVPLGKGDYMGRN